MGFPLRAWFDAERGRAAVHDGLGRVVRLDGELGPVVLRRLLDRARLPRREPDRLARAGQAAAQDEGRRADHGAAGAGTRLPVAVGDGGPAHRRRARSRSGSRSCPTRTSPARCCSSRRVARPVTTCGSPACATGSSRPGSARRSSTRCAASRSVTTCCSTTPRTSRSRPTTVTRCRRASTRAGTSSAPPAQPVYPQRPQLLGPRYGRNGAGGGIQAGRFDGKMIVVQCLLDEIAYPQQASWYHRRVQGVLGDSIDDRYRVWFVDHAMHGGPMMRPDETTRPAREHAHRQLPRRAGTGAT